MNILKFKMLTIFDKWLIVILLTAATLGVFMSRTLFADAGGWKYAQISVNGAIVKTIALREGYREEIYIGDAGQLQTDNVRSNLARNAIKGYNVHGYNIIEIDSTGVRVKEAGCPDHLCVGTGWVRAHSQQIVCLPNRMVVRIISDNEAGRVDDIAR